jgi:hypothetical protein
VPYFGAHLVIVTESFVETGQHFHCVATWCTLNKDWFLTLLDLPVSPNTYFKPILTTSIYYDHHHRNVFLRNVLHTIRLQSPSLKAIHHSQQIGYFSWSTLDTREENLRLGHDRSRPEDLFTTLIFFATIITYSVILTSCTSSFPIRA